MRKIELLSPAGSMEALKAAIHNGADAVYLGGKKFGARAFAQNFNENELIEAINTSQGNSIEVTYKREQEEQKCEMTPVKVKDNNYKINTLPSLSQWDLQCTTPADGKASWVKGSWCSLGRNSIFTSEYLHGSIYLNETYIKVNGVPWFGPGATKNLVPDGTVVGYVTVKDGIASGFSGSDYLKTPILPLSSTNSFEINLKISVDYPDGTYTQIAGNDNTVSFQFGGSTKKLYAYVLDSNGRSALTYTYNYQSEISTIKLVYQNSTYSLYINGIFIESLAKGLPTTDYHFGIGTKMYRNSSGDRFLGSIDLNNTYIKVGSDYIYRGMVPQVKTCSVVGCTGTADLTQEDKNIILNKGWSLTVQ